MTDHTLPSPKQHPTLVRQRKFWMKSIFLSLAGLVLSGVLGGINMMDAVVKMLQANTNLPNEHDTVVLNDAMATVRFPPLVAAALCTLAFVWMVISIVRYFAVPKTA